MAELNAELAEARKGQQALPQCSVDIMQPHAVTWSHAIMEPCAIANTRSQACGPAPVQCVASPSPVASCVPLQGSVAAAALPLDVQVLQWCSVFAMGCQLGVPAEGGARPNLTWWCAPWSPLLISALSCLL